MKPILKHILALLCLLALAGCNLDFSGATLTPFPTPDIPRVRFLYPENNAAVVEGAELRIEVLAEDPGAGVARVELLVDDVFLREGRPEISASVPTFTVTFNWLAQGIGRHSLSAVAYRLDGAASAPTTILVQVVAPPTAAPGA